MPDENRSDTDNAARLIPIEHLDPLPIDEALSIIGEPTRARIIAELGDARATPRDESSTLRYSELMDRVGVRDSGRFHYHLEKLIGSFIKKRAAGYALRHPGQLIYEAIVSGTLTTRKTIEPFTVGDCPRCDGALSTAYHADHLLTVECTHCETLFDAVHFPARGLENRSKEELLDVAYQRRFHKVAAMRRGVCPSCGSVVSRDLQDSASITYGTKSVEEMAGLDVYAVLDCESCNSSLVGHPANVAITTPTVVGFYNDQSRDVARLRWWEPSIAGARDSMAVQHRYPHSVRIGFEVGGETLTITLDSDLQVTERSRSDR